MKTCNLIN
jgi:MFS family permease